ncbi:MAG: FG-GAP repeat domain-containing protein, partial [Terriglobales bacterium]
MSDTGRQRLHNLTVRRIPEITRRELLQYIGAVVVAAPLATINPQAAVPVTFVDIVRSAGIDFRHDNAASPEKYLIETMGSGCAWIDFDQNGLLDLYLANGAATRVYTPKTQLRSALYRNNGDGTFTDITA